MTTCFQNHQFNDVDTILGVEQSSFENQSREGCHLSASYGTSIPRFVAFSRRCHGGIGGRPRPGGLLGPSGGVFAIAAAAAGAAAVDRVHRSIELPAPHHVLDEHLLLGVQLMSAHKILIVEGRKNQHSK